MAEQIIQWLDGQAKDARSVEKICPTRHIRENQWQSKWNDMYLNDRCEHCYDYISDYECIFRHPVQTSLYFNREGLWDNLQAAKQRGTHIPIVNLAHFTGRTYAGEIVKSGGFKGGMKKFNEDANGHDVKAKFSWWSPIFCEKDIQGVRDTLGEAIKPILAEPHEQWQWYNEDDGNSSDQEDEGGDQDNEEGGDQDNEESSVKNDEEGSEQDDDQGGGQDDLTQLQKQFATSDAFNPNPQRNGNVYFQYNINDLCDYYRINFDCELQFKILGTFSYKKEVMHAVLVCGKDYGNGVFKDYPSVLTPEEDQENNEAVVTRDNSGKWVWKPQATGSEIERLHNQYISYPMYRRWEQVAFAFHIPLKWGKEAFISVTDLHQHYHII